LFC
jgi:hypothetical protein